VNFTRILRFTSIICFRRKLFTTDLENSRWSQSAFGSCSGSAALYRGGQLVTAGQSAPSPDGWWNLAFTAVGSDLRLTVNGLPVLAALDVSPLPPGTITLLSSDGLLVEWLSVTEIMQPAAEVAGFTESLPGELPVLATATPNVYEEAAAASRNFLDRQSGGCRYETVISSYVCIYDWMMDWTETIEFLYRYASNVNGTNDVSVQLTKVIGIDQEKLLARLQELSSPISPIKLAEEFKTSGMFSYDGFILSGQESTVTEGIPPNLGTWRTGQGPNVPSTWGNTVLSPPGTTTWSGLIDGKHFVPLIIHQFSNGKTTVSPPPNTQTTLVDDPTVPLTCTYVAVVTTSDARLANLSSCKQGS
jgi:hypothetical protein